MPDTESDCYAWAAIALRALRSYALHAPTLKLLGHHDTVAFHVTSDMTPEGFLLRLHRPVTQSFVGVRQRPDVIMSELLWLEALAHDTDLTIQQPIRNVEGNLVTEIALGADSVPCTLLRWVQGDSLLPDGIATAPLAEELGAVIGQLHQHTATWTLPPGFIRPSYDLAHFRQRTELLLSGVDRGILTPEDYAVMAETTDAILALLAAIPFSPDAWGLIHADLHQGNYVVHHGSVRPIDFSLCGFGYWLYDLGTALLGLKRDLRDAFLNGYERYRSSPSSPRDHMRLIDGFCVLSRLGAYVFMLSDPAAHEWLNARIPRFVAHECRRFLNGDSVLDAI